MQLCSLKRNHRGIFRFQTMLWRWIGVITIFNMGRNLDLKYLLECIVDGRSNAFKKSIRDYELLSGGGGPYTFRIHGQSHHLSESLLSEGGHCNDSNFRSQQKSESLQRYLIIS